MRKSTFSRPRSAIKLDPKPLYRFSSQDKLDLEFLEVGWLRFPKDELRKRHDPVGVRSRRHHAREVKAHNRVVELLAGSALASDHRIALRLYRCTLKTPCDSPLCWLCKHMHANKLRQVALTMVRKCEAEKLAWVTVVTSLVYGGVEEVAQAVTADKARIRDTFRRAKKRIPGFAKLRWIGQFEVDHIPPGGIDALPPYKRKTIMGMEGFLADHEVPFQLVHVHMVVHLGELTHGQLRHQLRKAFRGPRQVRVAPLRGSRSVDDNVQNLVGYTTKNLPFTEDEKKRHKFSWLFADNLLLYHTRMLHHLGGLAGLAFSTRRTG